MATIKSYTDISQSKTLSKILPLESADMVYMPIMDIDSMSNSGFFDIPECYPLIEFKGSSIKPLTCWSLAALLNVLPILDNRSPVIPKTFDRKYRVVYHSDAYEKAILTSDYDNPVDACYEMIIRLNELKML
jgi:hypothetical protein